MRFKLTFLVAIIAFSISSCSKGLSERNLIGTWQTTDYSISDLQINPQILEGAKEAALNISYTFNEDNTFTQDFEGEEDNGSGTWQIIDTNSTIEFTYIFEGDSQVYIETVKFFENNEMTWDHRQDGIGLIHTKLAKK